MTLASHSRLAVLLSLGLIVAACGGGGGGPGGTGGPDAGPSETLVLLKAVLIGANETTVVDPDARAAVLVEIGSEGSFSFAAAGQASWIGEVTGLHIHRGTAGEDGPVVVDLLGAGAAFDAVNATASGALAVDTALREEIVASPGDFYVNVHTTAAPAGLAREQLSLFTGLELHALVLGTNVTRVTDPDARGAFSLHVAPDGVGSYVIALGTPEITSVGAAHIHIGGAGAIGPVLVDLDVPSATRDDLANTLVGTVDISHVILARLCAAPDAYYANLHPLSLTGGIARGQLAEGVVGLWSPLRGDEETAIVDPDARGGATLELESFTTGRAMLAVPPAQDIGLVTGAHVHEGAAGVDGPVVIDLQAGADYLFNTDSFSAEGSIALDQMLYTRLLADPAGFYVNFHAAGAPAGLVRGQLTQEPVAFRADLRGDEETTVVDPLAAGTLTISVTGVHRCDFSLVMADPPTATILGAHVHDGPAGADGPILIDLLGGGATLAEDLLFGSAEFTGRTYARMMAFPAGFYGNAHTALAPAGIARGQLGLLASSVAPSGLAYATPVVYTEGVVITNNVPSSGGGAITRYSVAPPLPAGLVLDPVSGIVTGTPTMPSAAADYVITGRNAAGSADATVNITVNVAPPAGLQYTTPVTYSAGSAIPPNVPTSTGGAISSYGVSPALPPGLMLDTTTGVISGTPTAAAAAADYFVTGTNASGSTIAAVNITVTLTLLPPSGLAYATPVVYTTGSAISPNVPTVGGGAVSTWSVSPALPAGLSLHPTTGTISGTPTSVTAAADYTVTASNASGSDTATVNITVNLGPPTNLVYTNTPNIGYVGTAIANMVPSSEGGAVSSYSISPALPAGLSLNTTTGVISGTPLAQSAQTSYTVTATNSGGSTTATVSIVVY